MRSSTVARAVAFGVSISGTSALLYLTGCPKLEDMPTRQSRFQPPGHVFAIVWSLLYVSTGVAWALIGSSVDYPLGGVTAACCAWLVVYRCFRWKRLSLALLVLATLCSLVAVTQLRVHTVAFLPLLLPLPLWLAFATALSVDVLDA